MAIIPLPEWLPDLPAHQNPGLLVCRNVIARTQGSYGPFRDLSVYSDALEARCQGAFTARDNAGNVRIFAGDATRLRLLSSGSPNFADASRSVGGPYATSADDSWRFVQYGANVIATNFADDVQSYVLGSSSDFAPLSADAPKAKYAAIWKDFVVLGHVQGHPQRVRWSAIDDPTSWPAVGTATAAQVQSDQQDLVGDGGWIQGIIGGLGSADGVVIQERALWRVTYVGPPLIFTFDLVEGTRGTPAPGSIVQLGGVVAYLGEDGFYLFDGQSSRPIGHAKIDKTFFADFDQTYSSRMSAAVDPINKIFYWAYAGAGSTSGTPNRLLAYNWAVDRWSLMEVASEYVFRGGTFGFTADDADILGYTVDTSPFGPDSRFWAGGKAILAGFTADHRLGFFSGAPLAATVETGDLDLADGRRTFVSGIRPVADATSLSASVGYREIQAAMPAYSAATTPSADGFCAQRVSTRYPRARIHIPAGTSWSHLSAYEPRLRPAGVR
jgi:hypothetical protein